MLKSVGKWINKYSCVCFGMKYKVESSFLIRQENQTEDNSEYDKIDT